MKLITITKSKEDNLDFELTLIRSYEDIPTDAILNLVVKDTYYVRRHIGESLNQGAEDDFIVNDAIIPINSFGERIEPTFGTWKFRFAIYKKRRYRIIKNNIADNIPNMFVIKLFVEDMKGQLGEIEMETPFDELNDYFNITTEVLKCLIELKGYKKYDDININWFDD